MRCISGKVDAQGAEVDTPSGDHRLNHVYSTLQGIDPEMGSTGFEVAQEFVRLRSGRFWFGHTSRTLPALLLDRAETPASEFLCQDASHLKLSGTEPGIPNQRCLVGKPDSRTAEQRQVMHRTRTGRHPQNHLSGRAQQNLELQRVPSLLAAVPAALSFWVVRRALLKHQRLRS